MPVSISRWNAPPRAPRAIQAAMVRSSPSAGVSRCSRYASNRSAGAGVKTSTGRAMPAARSSAPSSIVATPYPQGSSGSSARETATAPPPYALALTTGRSRVPATRATVRAFSTTAARSTSTQARASRPLVDTLTGAGMIPGPEAKCKTMKRLHSSEERVTPRDPGTLVTDLGIQQRAASVGFDWTDASGPRAKIEEELRELDRETRKGKRDTIEDEIEIGRASSRERV